MSNDKYIYELLEDPNYKVLEDGTILTCRNKQGHTTTTWRKKPCYVTSEGYLRIKYYRKGLFLHRIVYAHFNGDLEPHKHINHIDGNKVNNRPENLELVSTSANNLHAYRVLKRKPVTAARKFTFEQAEEIRRLVAEENVRAVDLARKFGVRKGTIHYILTGRTYRFA
jgi:hypothetical protein